MILLRRLSVSQHVRCQSEQLPSTMSVKNLKVHVYDGELGKEETRKIAEGRGKKIQSARKIPLSGNQPFQCKDAGLV